ncbi:alpha/beta hydrolase [Roseibium sp.]|uniref:alpha/beta hydrolase n=1 Tax=Roseibium sp. TaxID=1936156 RepID=UPI003B520A8D
MVSTESKLAAIRVPVLAIALAVLLTACGSRPETGALAISTQAAPKAEVHDILIATTREKDTRPDTYFNGNRSETLSFAKASISVPPTHQPGAIEWPRSAPGNPNTDFVAREAGYVESQQAFLTRLNQQLRKRPKGQRNILLFIHGYNTMYSEGLYRLTQFVHDSKADVVPVLFTWASRGQVTGYVYDLNSAAIARDSLIDTLQLLNKSDAETISILAHSMGNYLLMETGRQMTRQQFQSLDRKLKLVVMAAPDIDIDLFKSTLRRNGPPRNPYIIVVSRDDSALRISRRVAGGIERLGAYSDDEELAELGAIVVDVTDLQSDQTSSHSKFAALAQFSPELRQALISSGLTEVASIAGPVNRGENLGNFVGNTVALPIKIVTSPFN